MSSRTLVGWSARAGMLGGILWALLPLGFISVSIQDAQPGTPGHVAVAALYWLLAVLPLALLLVGLAGLRAQHGETYGRLGKAGFLISFAALALMFIGNAVEVASLTFSGSESAVGHSAFLIGFLLLLIGSAPLGIALARTQRAAGSRMGGLLLVGLLPLGILLAVVLGTVAPGTDIGFWAAITVPYGISWTLIGNGLRSHDHGSAGQTARVA